MPDTRPGIKFNEAGVCSACINAEKKNKVDWNQRLQELKELCKQHRHHYRGKHDCIVTVSGGKDSYFQVFVMKELMGMNPLLINVWNNSWTTTGILNFNNMLEAFSCECISLHMNRKVSRLMAKKAFEKLGSPMWYWDKALYVYPIKMAIDLKIPLVVYGENISYEYGGGDDKETMSAMGQINNDVVKIVDPEEWLNDDITIEAMNFCTYPPQEEIEKSKVSPIYLSYFLRWDGFKNTSIAKDFGFKSLNDTKELIRHGYIEDYDSIDSLGYLVHPWLKYPKFGHARTTDVCSSLIRNGYMTRKHAVELVRMNDHLLDRYVLNDFLTFIQETDIMFWKVVDKFYNRDIFEKVEEVRCLGDLKLKNPIWEEGNERQVKPTPAGNATE
jgi:N-acetyl sugar amidotransferase